MESSKVVHTVCIDTGPIIKDVPSISSLLAQCEKIVTVPAVVAEIKDAATRSRFDVTFRPFVELRNPSENSLKAITDFARRTGDLSVLSRQDIQLLALTRDLEIERNGGDWRLRNLPGQKGVNGPPPARKPAEGASEVVEGSEDATADAQPESAGVSKIEEKIEAASLLDNAAPEDATDTRTLGISEEIPQGGGHARVDASTEEEINKALESTTLSETFHSIPDVPVSTEPGEHSSEDETPDVDAAEVESDSDDSDGWITPSNLKKHVATDSSNAPLSQSKTDAHQPGILQAALLTSDFAMQNVALQMNLNLLSGNSNTISRIRTMRTFVLRCHACFMVVKDTSKQFCPRCGKPTLTRVSCSTSSNGEFRLHLKKNMQWNTRGDRYSIPKPVTGSASGKVKSGGGKDGWGAGLILAEDQKEYVKAVGRQRHEKHRDLMDEDRLPGILSGSRDGGSGGRIRVGAGRNVNSRKR